LKELDFMPAKIYQGENADFSMEVIRLYKWSIGDMAKPYDEEPDRDIRRCANGLRFITVLLTEYMRETPRPAGFSDTGVQEAYGIIEHLLTGKAHPISRHIQGIHSARFRANAAPVADLERLAQAVVVATVIAIMEQSNEIQSRAIRQIVNKFISTDFAFTENQIKGWVTWFKNHKELLPQAIKSKIFQRSQMLSRSADDIGCEMITHYWSVDIPWD
jgi:hypothetical protein